MKRLLCCFSLLTICLLVNSVYAVPVTDGLIIHLKADSLSLNDNDAVTSWADSATADSVDGTVSEVQGFGTPVFKKNIYNGMSVVRFTDDILCTASQFTLPNPDDGITVVALFTGGGSGLKTERLGQIGYYYGSGGQVIGLEVSTDSTDSDGGSGFRFNNGRALVKTGNPLTTGFHVAAWKMAQGAQHQNALYYVDGVLQTLNSVNNPTNTTTLPTNGNTFSLGTGALNGGWIGTDYYTGDLAEILVYNGQLTTDQLDLIYDYLDNKYDITTPVTDGLIVHLKANSLTLNDNDAVTSWADSATDDSVDGTVSAVGGYGTPVYVANACNGKPAVRFESTESDVLASGTWSWDQTKGVTVFMVCTGGLDDDEQRAVHVGKSGGESYKSFDLDVCSNQSGVRFNNGYCLATSPFDVGDWHLSVRQMPQGGTYGDVFYSVDGSDLLTTSNYPTKVIAFDASDNDITLGAGWQSSAFIDWYDGDVAEVMVYNKQLSEAEIKLVTRYLNNKYDVIEPQVTDGLIIHLKANALALDDGDPVTTWADSATNDSVNGTVSELQGYGKPVYIAQASNGLPAVRFENTESDVLASGTWSWSQGQGVTVFMVCTGGTTDAQRAVQVGKTGGTSYKCFGCDVSSNQSGARFNNGYCVGDSPFSYGDWHLSVRQIAQGGGYGSVFYSVDDITYLPTTTNYPARNIAFEAADNDITLGAGWQNSAFLDWYDGDIAEVLVYNKQLTPAQIKGVTCYLNIKYDVYDFDFGRKFTIVAIPDTQGYPNHTNQPASTNLFINEMQFIVDNANNMNIVFATHEGDVVMTSNSTQYGRAKSAMDRLLNTIPFGMSPGNHDYDDMGPSYGSTLWNSYFGRNTDYFRDKSWYGGAFLSGLDTSGMTTYQTFSTDFIDFLHISLECDPDDTVLNWAQGIVNAHPGWPTIVTTHSYLKATDGSYKAATSRDPLPRNNGQQIWDEFIKVNPQIFMVLCGHSFDDDYVTSQRRVDNNNAGYPVYQLLADNQACYSGTNLGNGGGWIRLMEVDPAANTVRVRTYSTILNKYSSDPSLTDGSTYARTWAPFNYKDQGTGDLYGEGNTRSSEFTIPFIYGKQLP